MSENGEKVLQAIGWNGYGQWSSLVIGLLRALSVLITHLCNYAVCQALSEAVPLAEKLVQRTKPLQSF